jgi:hypothetical protein
LKRHSAEPTRSIERQFAVTTNAIEMPGYLAQDVLKVRDFGLPGQQAVPRLRE